MERIALYRFLTVTAIIVIILAGCLLVLKPFIPAMLLAIILCLSTWPAYSWLQDNLRIQTKLAALLMTLLLATCFIVPLIFLGTSLAESFSDVVIEITRTLQTGTHEVPSWLPNVPYFGPHLVEQWTNFFSDKTHMNAVMKEYAGPVSQWLITLGAGIGHGMLELSLGVFLSYFLFRHGPVVLGRLRTLSERMGGEQTLRLFKICESSMMSLVYGILGTALALGALATIGFWIAGIPGAPFLGLLTFLLGIVPGGPPLVLVPATAWLFYKGDIVTGAFLAVWSLTIIVMIDLIIRPYLISLGTRMPLLVVLLGVFGGVAAFGFIGLFIGPTLLALAYTLIAEWSHADKKPEGVTTYG
jgi:predicted PurR-regulated permease PerM